MKKKQNNEALSPEEGYDRYVESIVNTRPFFAISNDLLMRKLKPIATRCNKLNSTEGKLTAVQIYSIMVEKMSREILFFSNLILSRKTPDKNLIFKMEDSAINFKLYKCLKRTHTFKNKSGFLEHVVKFFRLTEKHRYALASDKCWDMLPEIESDIKQQYEKVVENFSISYENIEKDYRHHTTTRPPDFNKLRNPPS